MPIFTFQLYKLDGLHDLLLMLRIPISLSFFQILYFQIGPNVSIGQNVQVAAGARIKESIVLNSSNIGANSLVLYAVIGKKTKHNPAMFSLLLGTFTFKYFIYCFLDNLFS